MTKTMAEVLEDTAHDHRIPLVDADVKNLAAALSAAGFGLVSDAGAKALEDAADAAFKDKGIQGLRRVLIGNWLRARAAAVRGEDAHD